MNVLKNIRSLAAEARMKKFILILSIIFSMIIGGNSFALVNIDTKSSTAELNFNLQVSEKDPDPTPVDPDDPDDPTPVDPDDPTPVDPDDPTPVDPDDPTPTEPDVPETSGETPPNTGHFTQEKTAKIVKSLILPIITFAASALIFTVFLNRSKLFKKTALYQTVSRNKKTITFLPIIAAIAISLPAIIYGTLPVIAETSETNPFNISLSSTTPSVATIKQGQTATIPFTLTVITDNPTGYVLQTEDADLSFESGENKITSITTAMTKASFDELEGSHFAIHSREAGSDIYYPLTQYFQAIDTKDKSQLPLEIVVKTSEDLAVGNYQLQNVTFVAETNDVSEYFDYYTINYDLNGSDSSLLIPSETKLIYSLQSQKDYFSVSDAEPTREHYEFSGWNTKADGTGSTYHANDKIETLPELFTSISESEKSLTLYAKWQKKNTFSLDFNLEGVENAEDFPNQISEITETEITFTLPSQTPLRTGYTFQGFSSTETGLATYQPGDQITLDISNPAITLYAIFEINSYTITFKNYDNTILQSSQWEYGSLPTYNGSTPEKPADAQYSYTFSGWDQEIITVTGEATYQAVFANTTNSYTITFKNYDNTILQSSQWEYGSLPTYNGSTPEKPADAQYAYSFNGWDSVIQTVTGDAIYTAVYSSAWIDYTITFKNDDLTVLETKTYHYGETIEYTGQTPTKARDDNYSYVFSSWNPILTPETTVTGNQTFVATYNAIPHLQITYNANGGDNFQNGTQENVVKYAANEKQSITKYASSKDAGGVYKNSITDPSQYTDNQFYSQEITIAGAKELTISLYYATEGTWDWICVQDKNGPAPQNANSDSANCAGNIYYGSQTGASSYGNAATKTISGDTAVIWFRSDSSNVSYGFWAEITGEAEGSDRYGIYEEPTRDEYEFLGWSEEDDATEPTYATEEAVIGNITENKTLYAVWRELPKSAKAILTEDGNLNFIYDSNTYTDNTNYSYSIDGANTITSTITAVYDVPEDTTESIKPDWVTNYDIISANFDPSFKDFSPTSTAYWFYKDRYLSTITNVENLNTSSVTNMHYMFYYASSLTFLTLPDGFGQSATDVSCMFYNASSLTSLTLPDGFGQSATDVSCMFYNASSLTSLTLPSGFGQSATDMNYMFFYASSLTSLDLPSGFGQSATDMNHMFYYASSLTSLTLPSGFGQSATYMYYMFFNASSLTSLTLPSGFGQAATSMGSMFSSASSLTSLTLPAGFGQNAWDMRYMFSSASSLTSLTLPAGFGQNALDMSYMFERASSLTSLTLPSGFGQSATNMESMFQGASSLTSLTLPAGFGQSAIDMSDMFRSASSLTSLTLPSGFGQSATDMSLMFYGVSLTSLTLPSGFGQKATKMSSMFYGASSLEHIYVPAGTNWATKTPAVTSSLSMFYGASKLPNYNKSRTDISAAHIGNVDGIMGYFTGPRSAKAILTEDGNLNFIYDSNTYTDNTNYSYSIDGANTITSTITAVYDVPEDTTESIKPDWETNYDIISANFDPSFKDFSPTSTAYWFYKDRYLSTITNVENLNTSSVTNMSYMFYYASSLTSLTLPSGFGQAAISMEYMFDNASSLTSLTLPSGFGQSATYMHFMFSDASSLTSLTLPSGFGQNATDMGHMFSYASSLTSLTLPSGFGQSATYMNHMFFNASSLTSLTLPEGFGSQTTDMSRMFMRARSLTSLTLPSGFGQSATYMHYMFYDASSLTSLTLPSGFGQAATNMESMFYAAFSLENIYVPAGTNWATKTPAVTSSGSMFLGASKLPNYNYSRTDISAAHIGDVDGVMGYFTGPRSAKAILTEDGNLNFIYDSNTYTDNTNYSYSIDGTNTITSTITAVYDVPKNSTSSTIPEWTGTYSNNYSPDITSANFDSSFKDFSPTSTACWFYEDRYLSTITNVENLNTSSVTNMGWMFYYASSLTSLTLPSGFGQSATNMHSMFASASSLTSLTLPSGFGQSATDMHNMFFHARSLTSLTLPDGFGQNATDMSGMFTNASSLTSLTLPSGFGQSATNMDSMFWNASSLENIYVPAGTNWATKTPAVTSSTIMFAGASKLPNYNKSRTGISAAHIGDIDGIMGYFTDVCEKDNSCGEVQGQQGQQSEQQPPLMSYSPISEQSTEESTEPEETPVSTGEEKKSTKKSDTKSEQTEPLGVEKSVEKSSTVDTATVAVIVASFVLVSAGAVIIFLIEKRRNEDEE